MVAGRERQDLDHHARLAGQSGQLVELLAHDRGAADRASICKVGRDEQISLVDEGVDGLARMGAIADKLMLRSGGCSGCVLSGSCTVCRPLAKLYQQAKAPLDYYCQHGRRRVS
jgi:hypothetical protein